MNMKREYYIDGNLAFKTAKVRDDVIAYNGFDGLKTFDPFDKGLHKYTFKNLCVEDKDLELGDDATKIVLSTKGTADDVSPEMKEFLAYVAGSMPRSDFTQKIDKAVGRTKRSRKMRREYMTLEMYGRELSHKARLEGRKEGIEIGIEQGIEKSLKESINKMISKQGITPEEACSILDYPFEKYCATEGQTE